MLAQSPDSPTGSGYVVFTGVCTSAAADTPMGIFDSDSAIDFASTRTAAIAGVITFITAVSWGSAISAGVAAAANDGNGPTFS